MLWVPAGRVLVVMVATPAASRGAVWVPPPPLMVKVTVPVGVPVAGGTALTVAVMVTVSPKSEGSGADVTVVRVEGTAATVWVWAPLEALKLALPRYFAVTLWLPSVRLLVVTVATPLASRLAERVPPPPP